MDSRGLVDRSETCINNLLLDNISLDILLHVPRSVDTNKILTIRRVQVTRTYTRETWRHRKLTERIKIDQKSIP
jgi:hypothetical protein